MSLHTFAQSLSADLGPAFHLRHDYEFVIPSRDGLSVGRADAVIFASAVPSIHTAAVGFHSLDGNHGTAESALEKLAYLGAPLLVGESKGSLALYKYFGASTAEKIGDQQTSPEWVRARVLQDIDSPQLRLPLATTRALLIQDTRDALEKSLFSLMDQARQDRDLTEQEAFRVAMAAIRRLILPSFDPIPLSPSLAKYAQNLARRVEGQISFANVPAESIAELYERFAVTDADRRRLGVVYTPSWLARYVVDRLPAEAFATGRTLDPTCGSGTFLVCVLERVAERANRDGKTINAELLQQSVCGMDRDQVAIEAARLSLDMFARSVGIPSATWNLSVGDATKDTVAADWLVGNLPFGYRTFQGTLDISAVILKHIHETNPSLRALSLIVPDSMAYALSARPVRALLRSAYNLQEVTKLPERVFASSTATTMVIAARKDKPEKSVLVRDVREEDLASFKAGISISSSFYADFPASVDDPWSFSPFSNEFARAGLRGQALGEVAVVRVGLQTYGLPASSLGAPSPHANRPLLTDPAAFAHWHPGSIQTLPTLKAKRGEVRRHGPWEFFKKPKVIVRSTTDCKSSARLAAIPDDQGVWFTDKFTGIWPSGNGLSVQAIAAYLQTRFARVWYQTNNPSRKLRVRTLSSLPIPKLPSTSWARAADLAPLNHVARPPGVRSEAMLQFNGGYEKEWEWFNACVDSAFGLDQVSSSRLGQWLAREGEI